MEPIERILERFEQIASVPRPTKHEQKISAWLQQWTADHHFISQSDSAGNLVIRVPASPGYESRPTVVLQGHMDMVCEKATDSTHDFLCDPIRCIREGDWLHADKTTLGADNGIAIAIALALVEDKGALHPPLELLFTVEEEVGIGGASHLDPALISGKILINLDSEEEGYFVVGCAGGNTIHIELPVSPELTKKHHKSFRLMVKGLQGGHSGVDIHKHRGNANRILARALDRIQQRVPIQIRVIRGGTAHNAIPRQAEAVFTCPGKMSDVCSAQLISLEKELQDEYSTSDPDLRLLITADEEDENRRVAGLAQSGKIVQLLMALPHGVAEMSASIEGFVETSNNLAVVELVDGALNVTSSQRSTVMSRLEELNRRIEATARLAGAQVTHTDGYPAWGPKMDSSLLQKSVQVYQELFGQRPEVKIIHAGLECGIIGERCGDMDMISLGPTIKNAHSPNEMLHIPSVGRVWSLLISLLDTF
jgi:dipeptidase D